MSTTISQESPASPSAWKGIMLDLCLVSLTIAVLAGTAWHLNRQLKNYHIPTQLELAMEDSNKLAQQLQGMEAAAFQADEQLRLRQRHLKLQTQLDGLNQKTQEKKANLVQSDELILARQHSIRQADKDARNLARNQLLPGMVVGLIRTSNGKVYQDSIIRGIDNGLITIRHQDGQARFNLNLLVKETLPPLARYAFGLNEIVDMSDFDITSSKSRRSSKKTSSTAAPKKSTISTEPNYDLPKGQPAVDANSPNTSDGNTGSTPSTNDTWQEPLAPLPL